MSGSDSGGILPAGLAAGVVGAPLRQVALVVADLDGAVRAWWDVLGVGPWTGYRLEPPVLQDMRYRGAAATFGLRHALTVSGGVQVELVQPTFGPSIFAEHLEAHGEGLQHLGFYVQDHAAAVERAVASGWLPVQSARGFGAGGDGAFAYFEVPGVASVVELIEAPALRRAPELVYPPPAAGAARSEPGRSGGGR